MAAPTPQELQDQAQRETDQAVQQEIDPYLGEISQAQGGMGSALEGLGNLYGSLMPYVQGAAKFTSDWYERGLAQEKGIYEQAIGRLNAIRAQRGAQAQRMAQLLGGPVNVEAFLSPLNTSMAELPNAQANTLFHSNALSQAGVQEAEAFAGRVFPLMRVEQEKQIRNDFGQRIRDLQDTIARIKAGAVGRTQTRLDELTQREREYQLQQEQMRLERLKADRDWRLAQSQEADNKARLANEKANLLGYYDKVWVDKQGRKHTSRIWTLGARQTNAQTQLDRDRLTEEHNQNQAENAISWGQIEAAKIDKERAYQQNNAAMAQDYRDAASKYLDAAMTPGAKAVTSTTYDEIPADQLKSASNPTGVDKSGLIPRMVNGTIHWYRPRKVTTQVTTPVITNANELYNFLLGHGIRKDIALEMVKKRLQLGPKWKPGDRYDPDPLSQGEIDSMNFNTARQAARTRGWKPDPQHPATINTLVNWLYNFYGFTRGPSAKSPSQSGPPAPGVKQSAKAGTNKAAVVNNPDVVWDPRNKYWYNTRSGKVILRGHPPDRNGNPT